MMTNKERLEELTVQINGLSLLIEEFREREIYPVSFFSKAYDITNGIQEYLRQVEIAQIELFEKQMKEHQAQLLSLVSQPTQTVTSPQLQSPVTESPAQPETATASEQAEKPVESVEPVPEPPSQAPPRPASVHPEKAPPPTYPEPEIKQAFTHYTAAATNLIDLKKIMTLNDRFLFCRELFARDENLMNRTIADLNRKESYDASIDYVQAHFDWDFENEHVADFIAVLKKRFA